MGSYIYLKGGELKNRVAFYNFSEVGKNVSTRMVGGFHEMYDSSMIPKVCYLDIPSHLPTAVSPFTVPLTSCLRNY